MQKKNWTLIVGGLSLVLGFLLTYYNFFIVFLIVFLVLPLLFLFSPPRDVEAYSDERKAAAQRKNRIATIAGLFYALGAVLAFILKYYIIGVS